MISHDSMRSFPNSPLPEIKKAIVNRVISRRSCSAAERRPLTFRWIEPDGLPPAFEAKHSCEETAQASASGRTQLVGNWASQPTSTATCLPGGRSGHPHPLALGSQLAPDRRRYPGFRCRAGVRETAVSRRAQWISGSTAYLQCRSGSLTTAADSTSTAPPIVHAPASMSRSDGTMQPLLIPLALPANLVPLAAPIPVTHKPASSEQENNFGEETGL
jgi:hypothetical protein